MADNDSRVAFAPLTIAGLDWTRTCARFDACFYLLRLDHWLFPDALDQAVAAARLDRDIGDAILSRPLPTLTNHNPKD